MTTPTNTTTRPKAPKTPSAGQFRAIARALDHATLPTQDPLLAEARDAVRSWLDHQADLRVRP